MSGVPVGSEFNRRPEVRDKLSFPEDVYLVDSTIRSLQSGVSGSTHSPEDLLAIGVALDGVGVREQIINVSWRDGLEVIKGLRARAVSCRLVATFRARDPKWRDWAKAAAAAGADEICLESARDTDHLREAAGQVRALGLEVSHSFAEPYHYEEIIDLMREGVEVGCTSQSFHDSYFGMAIGPEAIKEFIRSVRGDVPLARPLYVHLSNFFGHATMTAIAALSAGASAADVCANGTGHHCGHTSLAEVALVLEYLYGVSAGIRLDRLRDLSALVHERTGVPLPLTQPVVGDYSFMQDGAYWAAEAHLPLEERVHATFPFLPDVVGSEERVIWSDRTLTPDAVALKLTAMGRKVPSSSVLETINKELRATLEREGYPRWLSDEEFSGLLSTLLADDADALRLRVKAGRREPFSGRPGG